MLKDINTADKILTAKKPTDQKKLGRLISNFNARSWTDVRKIIAYKGNKFKFIQNKDLYKQLGDTQDKILVEASLYDKVLEVGLSENDLQILYQKNWKSTTYLGNILTNLKIDIFGY